MKHIKIAALLFLFNSFALNLMAQQDKVGGWPLFNTDRFHFGSDISIEGDYLFPKTFSPANLYTTPQQYFPNIPAYFNFVFHVLIYKDEEGVEKYPSKVLPKIAFLDKNGNEAIIFKSGFPLIDSLDGSTYYQVLDSGKVTLLKYYYTYFLDNKEPFSNRVTRTYHLGEQYFVLNANQKMINLKTDKSDLIELFADKRPAIESFLQKNKIKPKREEDLVKLFHYYNSL